MLDAGLNYGAGSIGTLFALLAIASLVIFIVYASEWANNDDTITFDNDKEQTNRYIQAEFAYEAFVIAALTVLAGMHSYIIVREVM